MADVGRRIAKEVDPRWDAARVDLGLARLHERRARRRVLGAGALLGVVLAGSVALLVGAPDRSDSRRPFASWPASASSPDPVWTATPADADSVVSVLADSEREVSVAVVRGRGRFEMAKGSGRVLAVHAGDVEVRTVGTRFVVERRGGGAFVTVDEGRVRVRWPGGGADLVAPGSGAFPPAAEPGPVEPVAARAPDWRVLADQGRYEEAYRALRASAPTAMRDRADELLLAADVARLSGHPQDALAPLRRVVADHARDPRASLAAFTLGRVLLGELGRPREAAEAFAAARALAPAGSLAEDALAREVEAWSRAGVPGRARELALEYVARHPYGARTAAVRRFGGLD